MESLEQLHKQLDGLDELRTIVKTMKALSAASIHQYQQAVSALNGYYQTIEHGLHVVLKDLRRPGTSTRSGHEPRRFAAIIFGSDHGLCGRFNEEITEHAVGRISSTVTDPGQCLILAVGARLAATLEHEGLAIEEGLLAPGSVAQITATVQQVLLKIDEWRARAGVLDVCLFYNRHSRARGYQPTGVELLPINLRRFHRLQEQPWPSRSLPMFTLEREVLLSRLLRQYLFVSIFRALAESQASEHASRLAAMQSAQRNLDERLDEVSMVFRRARQNAITAELLDVVSGFEAVSGGGI